MTLNNPATDLFLPKLQTWRAARAASPEASATEVARRLVWTSTTGCPDTAAEACCDALHLIGRGVLIESQLDGLSVAACNAVLSAAATLLPSVSDFDINISHLGYSAPEDIAQIERVLGCVVYVALNDARNGARVEGLRDQVWRDACGGRGEDVRTDLRFARRTERQSAPAPW
jgi:hypothetical protein